MYYDPEFFCCQYCEDAMRQIPGFLRIYIVRPWDTLASIASRFNTTGETMERAISIQEPNLIFPGQRLIIPRMPMQPGHGFPRVYIVQSGDTLYSIANRFNVSIQRLIEVNRLEDPDVIYPGMRIIIPAQ